MYTYVYSVNEFCFIKRTPCERYWYTWPEVDHFNLKPRVNRSKCFVPNENIPSQGNRAMLYIIRRSCNDSDMLLINCRIIVIIIIIIFVHKKPQKLLNSHFSLPIKHSIFILTLNEF